MALPRYRAVLSGVRMLASGDRTGWAGAAGLKPRNGVANYPFEMSHEFSGDSAKLRYQRLFAEELRIAETLGDVTARLAYRTQARSLVGFGHGRGLRRHLFVDCSIPPAT
jgi:hypothetical protein